MVLEVATWNMQQKLGETSEEIDFAGEAVEHIKRIDADVLVLTDAVWLGAPNPGQREVAHEALSHLKDEGYEGWFVHYGDLPGHFAGRYLVTLSRVPAKVESFQAGISKFASLNVLASSDSTLKLIGGHFDDLSESNRINQAISVKNEVMQNPGRPTLIMGDMNNLHRNTVRAAALSAARPLTNLVPDLTPRNEYEYEHGRPHHINRLGQMARGGALKVLEDAGFRDADERHQPTFLVKGHPVVQLDHIMVNDRVQAHDFKVHPASVSDHLPISATVEF